MMIKNAEQLLVAAEVMKIAEKLQRAKFESDFGATHPDRSKIDLWNVENSLSMFVTQAYRNLSNISTQLDAIIGEDAATASMQVINSIGRNPAAT